MSTLTPEQRRDIERAGDTPVRVEDPETRQAYVILKAEVYERLRGRAEVEQIDPSFYEFGEFRSIDS